MKARILLLVACAVFWAAVSFASMPLVVVFHLVGLRRLCGRMHAALGRVADGLEAEMDEAISRYKEDS